MVHRGIRTHMIRFKRRKLPTSSISAGKGFGFIQLVPKLSKEHRHEITPARDSQKYEKRNNSYRQNVSRS